MDQLSINSLIESIKPEDPKLYDILKGFAGDIASLDSQLNPPAVRSKVVTNPTVLPDDVQNFIYTVTPFNIIFSWDAVTTAVGYEVRQGTVWATANFLAQISNLQFVINPILIGSTTYLIKAIDANGNYSANADSVVVTIPQIPAPIVTGVNVTNVALLTWIVPASSFQIAYYKITRNGNFIANITGTFFSYVESAAGTIAYGVSAVDIAGNVGLEAITNVTVTAPTDFILTAILTSVFAGTKTNCAVDAYLNALISCIDSTITYEHHFTTHAWASPNDQVNAGFPLYIEPGAATATYVETFDFGAIFNNVVVGITYLTQLIAGTVSLASGLEFSTDNITFTASVVGPTAFASAVRYVRVTLNFTGGTPDLLALSNFQCGISVHREMDGGSGTANAGDAGGTVFTFNKTFKSVESVTATPLSTSSFKAVVTAITTTTFKVLVFNDAGVRQTVTVEWKARGVL